MASVDTFVEDCLYIIGINTAIPVELVPMERSLWRAVNTARRCRVIGTCLGVVTFRYDDDGDYQTRDLETFLRLYRECK